LHVIDLSGARYALITPILYLKGLIESKLLHPIPTLIESRVGAAAAVIKDVIYIWGGRGGKDMAPLHNGSNIHAFDTIKSEWNALELTKGYEPEDRSYHTLVTSQDKLYLHAGCPTKGRLSTLHSLDIGSPSPSWVSLPSAPDPPRGGTALAPAFSRYFLRFGGFSGYEIGGNLDVYDTKLEKWSSYDLSQNGEVPKPRSVHAFVPVNLMWEDSEQLVALLLFGELDPAPVELGHDGAGKFSNEVWALVCPKGLGSDLDEFEKFRWINVKGDVDSEWPEARGWFGASAWTHGKVVVVGGLNGRNERLGDSWILEVGKAA
jgi:Galactose oxidase, central domain